MFASNWSTRFVPDQNETTLKLKLKFMKKMINLGRSLSASEQKQIRGGYNGTVCTCNSCSDGDTMKTVICGADSLGGYWNCLVTSSRLCASWGCQGTSCNAS